MTNTLGEYYDIDLLHILITRARQLSKLMFDLLIIGMVKNKKNALQVWFVLLVLHATPLVGR